MIPLLSDLVADPLTPESQKIIGTYFCQIWPRSKCQQTSGPKVWRRIRKSGAQSSGAPLRIPANMDLAKLGTRIKQMREKRKLRQADVASALRISSQAVSKWERGENAPDISVLLALSRLLGVSLEWILSGNTADPGTFAATVFATGLMGYAERAAQTPPSELAAWANVIHYAVTEAVLCNDGIPIKCVGDGFLGFFSGSNQAERALAAARQAKASTRATELVIVLNAGPIFLGSVGHPEYARTDIIGETVNTAFLLMPFVQEHSSTRIGMTRSVADELPASADVVDVGEALVLGQKGALAVLTTRD